MKLGQKIRLAMLGQVIWDNAKVWLTMFQHNMFCTFLYNNCDDGILFKSVFYRKSHAIHSVWSAFQDYVLC